MATNRINTIHPYNDPRVTHEFQVVNGKKYHYVHGLPPGDVKATILCIHGFPDLWYCYRYIIPFLLGKGLRVIVPDMLGYGQTDAPRVPPADISAYSMKNHAADMAALLQSLGVPRVILLGHDWGSMVTSRIYLYHSDLVSHIINICTPFFPPVREYIPIRELVATKVPSFKYQIAFQDPQTEKDLQAPGKIKQFLNALQRSPRELGKFQVEKDIVESLGNPGRSSLLSEEDLDYLVKEFERNGFHGPLNWYKTRKVNFEDEKDLPFDGVKVPCLFIGANYDMALPPSIVGLQTEFIPHLTSRSVDAGHWALVEAPEAVIGYMNEWFDSVVFGGVSKI